MSDKWLILAGIRTFRDELYNTTIVAVPLRTCSNYEVLRLEQPRENSVHMASFGQPAGKMMICKWLANVKALRRITTEVIQHVPGLTGFNALCHDFVAQIMSQIDY
jgi:hypothetical protein